MIYHKKYRNLLQFESLTRFDSLFHFSSTRHGGVGEGEYSDFNLSFYSGDNPDDVDENRNRFLSMIDIPEENLVIPYQTHGDRLLVVDKSFLSKPDLEQSKSLHGIDALITDQAGICIGITTADCVPILVFDPVRKVLAAVHAGWRGTVAQLPVKVVFEMVNVFGCKSENLVVGIGPFISQEKFEVGDEVVEAFREKGFNLDAVRYYNRDTGKNHPDLGLANKQSLIDAGIPENNIDTTQYCTFENEDMFFSARRQGVKSGRMLTGGYLKI